jgi:hypothetical protein
MAAKILSFAIALLFILAACAALPPTEAPLQNGNWTERQPTPTVSTAADTPTGLPETFVPAQAGLARRLGIAPQEIQLKLYEYVEWRDGCLGVYNPKLRCVQVITPGYRVIFITPQGEFEVHTNLSGKAFQILPNQGG